MELARFVPVASITIGLVALCFQVFVLYPWHYELSQQFDNLQRVCSTLQSNSGM
jgi:hypothetical protein